MRTTGFRKIFDRSDGDALCSLNPNQEQFQLMSPRTGPRWSEQRPASTFCSSAPAEQVRSGFAWRHLVGVVVLVSLPCAADRGFPCTAVPLLRCELLSNQVVDDLAVAVDGGLHGVASGGFCRVGWLAALSRPMSRVKRSEIRPRSSSYRQ